MGRRTGVLLFLACFCIALSAEEMPIGKKVKVFLKSGVSIQGVLKSSNSDKAVLFDGKEDQSITVSAIEKIVVLNDQRPAKVVSPKNVDTRRRPVHRITPLAVSFGGSESGGAEICGYEFIGRNGMAVRVTPLSLYGFTEDKQVTKTVGGYYSSALSHTSTSYTTTESIGSFYWTPAWFRAYARNSSAIWPYLGGTLAYHVYDGLSSENDANGDPEMSVRPAVDFGIDFGGRVVRGNIGGKAFFGEGGNDKTLVLFNLGLSVGWGG